MSWLNDLLTRNDITAGTALIRLFFSFLAGGLIGLERESRRQPAGLRTHILISIGSTLLMLLSIYIPQVFFDMKNGDPGRIAAQVVSGIGFLGAGAILKLGNNVKGLTTAASIWVAAAVGLSIGAGLYIPSAIALGFIMVSLVLLENFEHRFFPAERVKTINLFFTGGSVDTRKVQKIMAAYGIKVQSIDVVQEIKRERVRVNLLVKIPVTIDIPPFYRDLRALSNIYKIEMDENL
jgi:putative Mg2+ transporter-C (MgtC) family protein